MNAPFDQLTKRDGLSPWQHVFVFFFSVAVQITRQWDAVIHAQFWAEAGHVFYAEAYNLGWWHPLFRTLTGYYQTLPRLSADLALLVPFSLAPLALNLIAICVQSLPVNLMLASRSSGWGSMRFRVCMAALFLASPNYREVSWIVNSQWLLGLSALLLIVATPPRTIRGKVLDVSLILLCAISGPFCIPLFPISLFVAWKRRELWPRIPVAILFLSCLIQAWGLLIVDPVARSHNGLGASFTTFVRIIGGQIYLNGLIGENLIGTIPGLGFSILFACIAIAANALIAACFLKSSLQMRMFVVFAGALLAASLLSPAGAVPTGSSPWLQLMQAPGDRYWFLPTLAFAWSMLWAATQPNPALRRTGIVLLCIFSIGIVRDWRRPAIVDAHFQQHAKQFADAAPGTTVTIPLNPAGWNMQLVKHPDR